MPIKFIKTLPKTNTQIRNGGLYRQWVRCGKKNCKCARGEKHEAYYFFTREAGKLTKTYVKKAEREAFAEIVNEARFWRMFLMPKRRPQLIYEFRKQLDELYNKTGNIKYKGRFASLASELEQYLKEED
jgi:hypothetical protein